MIASTLPQTPAWRALAEHGAAASGLDIARLLETEPDRLDALTFTLEGVYFDFSKNLIDARGLELLRALMQQQDVPGAFTRMMAGDVINNTEGHPALHTELRAANPRPEVAAALAGMKRVADGLRADPRVRDVVHIGIGGSDLGPRLVCQALDGLDDGPRVHFAANVDPDDLDRTLMGLDPQTTVVTVASKTFTTQETILNLKAARLWLKDDSRLYAMTANVTAAASHGIGADNILPLWDWVGGRFSVWSSVGLPVALAFGFDVFSEFLRGARAADDHMRASPPAANIPLTMAALAVWYRNFLDFRAYALLPYAERLAGFPDYVQQLSMESGGKGVDRDGRTCTYATAPVVFGHTGTQGQHAFFQMLHQGPDIIPCDFIGVAQGTGCPARHRVLMTNMVAQTRALMLGRAGEPHAACPGNRPSTAIVLPVLDAFHLGLLMAVYEHATVAEGFIRALNPFDQFGVELGKDITRQLMVAPGGVMAQNDSLDKSTNKLIFHTFLGK